MSIQRDHELREEQETQYEATLQADVIKKFAREAEQVKADQLEATKQDAHRIFRESLELVTPSSTLIDVVVRTPNGLRLRHEFTDVSQIKHVRAWITTEIQTTSFTILSQFPEKSYTDDEKLLKDAFSEVKKQMLIVQLEEDEDSDSSDDE